MTSLDGARVLVTGGAGFIGSHLVDALAETAARVAVVDSLVLGSEANLEDARRRAPDVVTFHREDAADPDALRAIVEREQPDVVFNLATKALLYSFFNPPGAFRVNTDIAANLCELGRRGGYGRLVHVSSSEVYGSAIGVDMAEDHPLLAETTYAAGKAGADLLVSSYARMFGLDVVIARPFNNYGPRQGASHLGAIVPVTIRRVLEGQAPVIQGDGEQTRDFIYVADTVGALCRLATSAISGAETFNVGSGIETSVNAIVGTLCEHLGYVGPIEHQPERPADVRRHRANVDRYRERFGEPSTTSLRDGLARTVEWWRR
jgi:UDP-glucose 4-epimerase